MSVAFTRLEKQILDIIEDTVAYLGYIVVRIKYFKGKILQIMIERQDGDGIGINDCELVSKQLSTLLDVKNPIDDHFNLEISSPGLDRPLTRIEDFTRFKGDKAKIKLIYDIDGRKSFKGIIEGLDQDKVKLKVDDNLMLFKYDLIAESNLIYEE